MAKFEIPKFRYLFQDENGNVWSSTEKPKNNIDEHQFLGGRTYQMIVDGECNNNWRDTLIDLETDDYDFEDGILMRVEK